MASVGALEQPEEKELVRREIQESKDALNAAVEAGAITGFTAPDRRRSNR